MGGGSSTAKGSRKSRTLALNERVPGGGPFCPSLDKIPVKSALKKTSAAIVAPTIANLHAASRSGNVDDVRRLIEKKANVAAFYDEYTPLMVACMFTHVDVATLLIKECELNLNAHSPEHGVTALFLSSQANSPEIVKLLLQKNADPDIAEVGGVTPVAVAASYGHAEVVALLVVGKADLNTADDNGLSPLWLACSAGAKDVVNTLLEQGVDHCAGVINYPNQHGITALTESILIASAALSEAAWDDLGEINAEVGIMNETHPGHDKNDPQAISRVQAVRQQLDITSLLVAYGACLVMPRKQAERDELSNCCGDARIQAAVERGLHARDFEPLLSALMSLEWSLNSQSNVMLEIIAEYALSTVGDFFEDIVYLTDSG